MTRAKRFLSTLPVRGATADIAPAGLILVFSIHAPREGSDGTSSNAALRAASFLSTLPVRGATPAGIALFEVTLDFYPRSP